MAAKSSLRVVVAPGNGCTDIHSKYMWYKWLCDKITSQGLVAECVLRDFPDTTNYRARAKYWLPFLQNDLSCDSNTVLVGHSTGALAAMRLLSNGVKLAGVVLVAAYHTDLGDSNERKSGYFEPAWQWDTMKQSARVITQLHSLDDHLVPFEEARYVHQRLQTTYHELNDQGHFLEEESPDILAAVIDTINKLQT